MRTGAPFESSNRYLPFPFAHDAPGLAFDDAAGTHGDGATLPVGAFVDAIAVLPAYRVYAGGGIADASPVRLFLYSITKAVYGSQTFVTLSFRDQNSASQLALEFEPATLVLSRGGYGRLRASNVSTGASITLLSTREFLDYVADTSEGVPDIFGTSLPLSPETVDFAADQVLSFSVHNTHDDDFRADPQAAWAALAAGTPGTIKSDVLLVPGYRMGITRTGSGKDAGAAGPAFQIAFTVQPPAARNAKTAANLLTYLPGGSLRDALTLEVTSDDGSVTGAPCPASVSYDYLRSLSTDGVESKILPDRTGNVNIVSDECLRLEAGGTLEVPVEYRSGEAIAANPDNEWSANSLLLSSTCDPCCGCDKYYRVGMGIQKLATEASNLRTEILGYISWVAAFNARVTGDMFTRMLVGASVAPNTQCDFSATDKDATVRVVTLSVHLGNPNTPFPYAAPAPLTLDVATGLPDPPLRTEQGYIGTCSDVSLTFVGDQSAWLLRQVARSCVGGTLEDAGTDIRPWNHPMNVVADIGPRKTIAIYVAFHALRDPSTPYSYPATIRLNLSYKVTTSSDGAASRSLSYDIDAKVEVT